VEVLVCSKWESTTNRIPGVGQWIIFYVSVSEIIVDSDAWLISMICTFSGELISMICSFSGETFSHRVLKSFGFIKISSIIIRVDHGSSLKLRFLILRIVLNRSVLFMKVTKVFIIFRILVIMTRIKSFVCMNRNSIKSCSKIIWFSKES